MSCECGDIDYWRVAILAYGPVPPDGVLLSGAQIQRFARRVIEDALKTPTLLGDR